MPPSPSQTPTGRVKTRRERSAKATTMLIVGYSPTLLLSGHSELVEQKEKNRSARARVERSTRNDDFDHIAILPGRGVLSQLKAV